MFVVSIISVFQYIVYKSLSLKENIPGNVYKDENLKRQIKAIQAERERMDLLFNEFIGYIAVSKKD
jgi:hypothetical protein